MKRGLGEREWEKRAAFASMRLFFVKALEQTHLFSSQIHMSTHAPRILSIRPSYTRIHSRKKDRARARAREKERDTRGHAHAHALTLYFTIQYIDRADFFLSWRVSSIVRFARAVNLFIYYPIRIHIRIRS